MLALFIVKREGRGFNTQHPSYIQLIISDVFYCGESKDHDSTGPTIIVKSYSEFISPFTFFKCYGSSDKKNRVSELEQSRRT